MVMVMVFLFNIKRCWLFSSILPSQVPRPDPCELGSLTKYFPTDKSKRTQRKRTLSTRGEREAISLWNVLARQWAWAVSTVNTNTKHWAQHWRPDTRYDTTLDTEQRWRHTEHQQLNLLNTKQAAQKNYVHKPQNTVHMVIWHWSSSWSSSI